MTWIRGLGLALVIGAACTPAVQPAPKVEADPTPLVTLHPLATATAPTTNSAVWEELRSRPLQLPGIAPGQPCPVSPDRRWSAYDGGQVFSVIGDGPAYPTGFATTKFAGSSSWIAEDGRRYNKRLWLVSSDYQGPVLVRGRQLDGPGMVHFDDGTARPPTELRIEATVSYSGLPVSGHRDRPSSTSVPGPGCYAYQVDGVGFTKVIIFRFTE